MEGGKAFLRATNKDGVSVYSHLTEVLATLLDQKAPNSLDMLEGVSKAVKAKHYQPDEIEIVDPCPEVLDAGASASLAATSALLAATAKPPEEGAEATGQVADVMYERTLFECAGVGLSPDETYKVYASLVALQKSKDLASVRFFGKMLGAPGDYYIAEAVYNTPPEPEEGDGEPPPPPPGAPVEETGVGCNKYVYFAATDPAGEWAVLPDVTPQQIVMSKKIRKYLTGDLNADVRAYPPFPGQEKSYLRAIIARIVAATTLVPAGKFSLDAEDPAAEPAEVEVGDEEGQRKKIEAAALAELTGWVTRYQGILDIGRCTNPPVEEEEEDPDNPKPPKPEPQKEVPYLSPLAADEWTTGTYAHGGPPVAVARSVKWPGAYSAYQLVRGGAECTATLYIGYGHETLDGPFKMEAPPPFEVEPDEVVEGEDMSLDEENAAYKLVLEAQVAEEAANLPDPEPAEE
jgi:radial spoke head protein 4A